MNIPFLFIGTTELLLIAGVALLMFGGKKLPEMMKGLGQGVREFKKGMKEDNSDNGGVLQDSEMQDENKESLKDTDCIDKKKDFSDEQKQ